MVELADGQGFFSHHSPGLGTRVEILNNLKDWGIVLPTKLREAFINANLNLGDITSLKSMLTLSKNKSILTQRLAETLLTFPTLAQNIVEGCLIPPKGSTKCGVDHDALCSIVLSNFKPGDLARLRAYLNIIERQVCHPSMTNYNLLDKVTEKNDDDHFLIKIKEGILYYLQEEPAVALDFYFNHVKDAVAPLNFAEVVKHAPISELQELNATVMAKCRLGTAMTLRLLGRYHMLTVENFRFILSKTTFLDSPDVIQLFNKSNPFNRLDLKGVERIMSSLKESSKSDMMDGLRGVFDCESSGLKPG